MLKTNSRKARENLRAYIQNHFDCSSYTDTEPETFPQMCAMIFKTFQAEKFYSMEYVKAHRMTELQVFEEWCSGLPSILDTCYYYNRSAVDDLGDILEQTEQQRNKYSERAAEKLLTSLIYRTIKEGALK